MTPSAQTPTSIKTLIQQLKLVLGSILDSVRSQFTLLQAPLNPNTPDESLILHQKIHAAYQTWKASQPHPPDNPYDEFCFQTAYMQFVRIFFLRVCEEYVLLPHPIQPQDNFFQLLKNLDQGLDGNSVHVFDWFTPDESTSLSLFSLLKSYNFKELNIDILGSIYNQGFIVHSHRSEKGQFYTPPHIVNYMLDTLGMPADNGYDYRKNSDFLQKTVGDLSCGSGSFLVAVAARKRALLQHLVSTQEVSQEYALQVLTSTLLGFDLNPFACFLAKLNLFLQCLPFLTDEQGQPCRSIKGFHIYCTDVLDPTSKEQMSIDLRNIDYLVGNPPYVSAHESSSNLRYRNNVWNAGIYQLLHQKWDLFVPFFERNLQLLRPGTGRLVLIVSNGIETEGYAERLRQALCARYRLLQIDFFPGLRLFSDAAVESTIVCVENRPPGEQDAIRRRRHLQADCTHFDMLPLVSQLTAGVQLFRWRYDFTLDKNLTIDTIPLCAIAYIGTGIEAQSSEYSDLVIDGKRQKRFTLHDVFTLPSNANERPAGYPDDGVLGDDIDCYFIRRKRCVAYEHYLPFIRGPRHSALFRTPEKLLLGETSGGYYDTESLFANHSVQVVVSWKALEQAGVLQEKGIQRVLRKSQQISGVDGDLPPIAEMFDLRYLLAIINSRFIRHYIASNLHEGTRKSRIYPDVWKRLPIKVISAERQREIALLVEEVQEEYRKSAGLTEIEGEQRQKKITALLTELETLVEALYSEPTAP